MSPRHGYDVHGDWEALAVGYALSALEPEDEARFFAHLAGCERCVAAVAEAARTVGELAYAVPDEAPSPAAGARLMAALAADYSGSALPPAPAVASPQPAPGGGRHAAPDHVPDHAALDHVPDHAAGDRVSGRAVADLARERAEVAPTRRRPAPRWRAGLAAAAALALLAALAWWNVRLRAEQDQLRRTVAQRESVIDQLTREGPARVAGLNAGADPKGRRLATVVVRTNGIDIITESLSPNDAATTKYWLWSLTSLTDTSPKPIAGFDVSTTALSVRTLPASARGLDKVPIFAVSREPSPGTPTKPTVVVAAGQAQ